MSDDRPVPETTEPGMHKEVITISDDRYLIYYTFDDSDDGDSQEAGDGPSAAASSAF